MFGGSEVTDIDHMVWEGGLGPCPEKGRTLEGTWKRVPTSKEQQVQRP